MMRRNFHSGRRDDRGPLMTDHLQMVQATLPPPWWPNTLSSGPQYRDPRFHSHGQDLDMELQLLKRKRQMIEEQQRATMNRQRQYDYLDSQPMFGHQSYNHQSGNLQINPTSHFYNRNELFHNNYGQNDWRGPPQKRFAGAPKNKPKKPTQRSQNFNTQQRNQNFNSQQGNFANQKPQPSKGPTPLMSSKVPIPQKMQGSLGPKPVRKDFKPTRVTKANKSSPQLNKLKSYSADKRGALVKASSSLVDDKSRSLILRSDIVPTQQMTGRLELALGNISKEVKLLFDKQDKNGGINFQSPVLQRALKQAIRKRLKSVMLGKVVSNVANICKYYREKFPVETDIDIVEHAVKAYKADKEKKCSMSFLETDDPEKYLKLNMNKLLDRHLSNMFSKLKDLYREEDSKLEDIINVNDIIDNNIKAETSIEANESMENIENDDVKPEAKTEGTSADKDHAKALEETSDNEKGKDVEVKTENNDVKIAIDKTSDNETLTGNDVTVIANDKETKPDELQQATPKENQVLLDARAAKAKYYDDIVEALLKKKLPAILPHYKDTIIKMMDFDKIYRTAKVSIVVKAREKAEAALKTAKKALGNVHAEAFSAEPVDVNAPKLAPRPLPYYAKIWGRPSLPKRKIMQSFLDQFHPMSIKKHKHMHNLLFVGFLNKDDFEKILAAHESVVGNSTLLIKVSERTNITPNDCVIKASEENAQTAEKETEMETDKPEDTSALDTQIDDLLASIRKTEEVKTEKVEETAQPEEEKSDDANKIGETNKSEDINKTEEINKNEEVNKTEETNKNEEPNKIEETEPMEVIAEETETEVKKNEKNVEELKNEAKESGKSTPTRSSSRVAAATPSTIRTRRASRLAQNN